MLRKRKDSQMHILRRYIHSFYSVISIYVAYITYLIGALIVAADW
jgi:hypothetical protein